MTTLFRLGVAVGVGFVFVCCLFCFFLRGGGEREMPGRTKCDVCEHPCAHSIGLKSALLWPLN